MIRIQTFGAIDLRDGDGQVVSSVLSQPQTLALLVFLSLQAEGARTRRDTLVGMLWPDRPDKSARQSLRQKLYELRRALGDGVIATEGDAVWLAPGAFRVDVTAFESALADGEMEAALEVYHGPFMDGFHVPRAPGLARWLDDRREAYRVSALDAALALAGAPGGTEVAAMRWARRAVELAPTSERATAALIRALADVGDLGAAGHAYRRYVDRIGEEHELGPSSELRRLVAEVVEAGSAGAVEVGRGHDPPMSSGEGTHSGSGGPGLGATMAGTGVALAGVAAVVWAVAPTDAPTPASEDVTVVAVSPLQVAGTPPSGLDGLPATITAELVGLLGGIDGMATIPPEAVAERYSSGDPLALGRALEADVVVQGSLRWSEDGVRVVADVIDVHSGAVMWEVSHDHGPSDLLSMRNDLTSGIASVLGFEADAGRSAQVPEDAELAATAFVEQARQILVNRPAIRPSVEDQDRVDALLARAQAAAPDFAPISAVRALAWVARSRGGANPAWLDSAVVAAEAAVARDPDHPLAQYALAHSLDFASRRGVGGDPEEMTRRRLESAIHAVRLNPGDPGALRLLAHPDYGLGRQALWNDRALALERAFYEVYSLRGHWLWILGDPTGSIEAFERAAQLRPEPVGDWAFRIPEVMLSAGRVDEARVAAADAVRRLRAQSDPRRTPRWARVYPTAIRVELRAQNYTGAERLLSEMLDRPDPFETFGQSAFHTRLALAHVYRMTGRDTLAAPIYEQTVAELNVLPSVRAGSSSAFMYWGVQAYVGLGDVDQALDWIEEAVERGWDYYYTPMGDDDPTLRELHDEPRFQAAMAKARARLDAEREWVHEMLALPEAERFRAMLDDAETRLAAMWAASG